MGGRGIGARSCPPRVTDLRTHVSRTADTARSAGGGTLGLLDPCSAQSGPHSRDSGPRCHSLSSPSRTPNSWRNTRLVQRGRRWLDRRRVTDPMGRCGLAEERPAWAPGGLYPVGAAGLVPGSDTPAGLPHPWADEEDATWEERARSDPEECVTMGEGRAHAR